MSGSDVFGTSLLFIMVFLGMMWLGGKIHNIETRLEILCAEYDCTPHRNPTHE